MSEPIVAEVLVPAQPMEAFVAFTAQMGEWWDPMLTPEPATFSSIEVDPEGEVAMVHENDRFVFGRVTEWRPSQAYAQDFWLDHGAEEPTTLRVTFTSQGGGTRVRLEHGGWAEDADAVRASYVHWDALLERYAAHAA